MDELKLILKSLDLLINNIYDYLRSMKLFQLLGRVKWADGLQPLDRFVFEDKIFLYVFPTTIDWDWGRLFYSRNPRDVPTITFSDLESLIPNGLKAAIKDFVDSILFLRLSSEGFEFPTEPYDFPPPNSSPYIFTETELNSKKEVEKAITRTTWERIMMLNEVFVLSPSKKAFMEEVFFIPRKKHLSSCSHNKFQESDIIGAFNLFFLHPLYLNMVFINNKPFMMFRFEDSVLFAPISTDNGVVINVFPVYKALFL